jgi:uncharacterized protein YbjT (DUF2867 family)
VTASRCGSLPADPKAARAALGDAGVEIVGVDFDDAATLPAGFTGSDKAFMSYRTSKRQDPLLRAACSPRDVQASLLQHGANTLTRELVFSEHRTGPGCGHDTSPVESA